MSNKNIILGIDPSLSSSGWAIIEYNDNKIDNLVHPNKDKDLFNQDNNYKPKLKDCDAITSDKNNKLRERVFNMYQEMERVIKFYEPDILACEDQYSHLNADTLKKLSHVRGQYMNLSSIYNIPFYLYYPTSVKAIFADDGSASKNDMVEVANNYFSIDLLKKEHDIADGIGVGMSYLINPKKGELI